MKQLQVRNQSSIISNRIDKLKSDGVRYEEDPIFGWPIDWNWDLGSNVPVSSFPREMYPERPTTLRTQIAQDAIRFQSRVWYETCPQYSGVINHLRNFIIGSGLTIDIVANKKEPAGEDLDTKIDEQQKEVETGDEELANDVQEYLDDFCNYKKNNINKRLYDTVLNYYRDGEDAIRLFPEVDGVNIRSVDTSTIRGPNNEITGPWSYGILTSWPRDYEDVKAYHVWYADNKHENVSPSLLKLLKSETTGSNVKRGVPLAYRMRKQIEQLIKLSDCTAIGEASRQSIPYLIQYQLQQQGTVQGQINSRVPSPATIGYDTTNSKGDAKTNILPGEIRHIGPGKDFIPPPTGSDSTWAYNMLCAEMATAINCPCWMVSGSSSDTNFASSLVAESPLVKLINHAQQQITDFYKQIFESVVEIAIAKGLFPIDTLDLIDIHCELPSPIARNMKEEIEVDINLMKENILSPQHLCARNGLDFEEEQNLIKIAEEEGWEKQQEIDPNSEEANVNKNNGDPNNEKKKLED